MIIHAVWSVIFKTFRKKRFRILQERLQPNRQMRILDVGGYPQTWTAHEPCAEEIQIVNVHEVPQPEATGGHKIRCSVADGCALPFGNAEFDIGFSNSVIEHVGDWERQKQFAKEMRRTSKKLWVQTPAQEFWIEPHYLTPFVHWLPKSTRVKIARNFTLWGWMTRPSKKQVEDFVNDIRLLTLAEMKELFPDCTILKERFLFFFTKSYIAVRTHCPADEIKNPVLTHEYS